MRSSFSSVKFYLVTHLKISNKEAQKLFDNNQVFVNNLIAQAKQPVLKTDEIRINENIIKNPEKLVYYAYYKPRGIECTMNKSIPNNLSNALNLYIEVFPIGRLDKDSEGLLLLTNDGSIYNRIIHSEEHQEKEYIVTVNESISDDFTTQMSNGVVIMGQTTRPCTCYKINYNTFGIILTQGLNRQIRRMCYKLGYKVETLKRIRIMNIKLNNLEIGQLIELKRSDFLI